ncbi:MAG: MarR family transcriptional regulator, partial [Candidatus Hinthialibacter sp.]
VGMTASGVTRMLLPMEKIGLIKSGPVDEDARVRSVSLSAGGKEKLDEALERFEMLADDIIPDKKSNDIHILSDLLIEIGGRILMK